MRCSPFKHVTSTSAAETKYGSIFAAGLLSSKYLNFKYKTYKYPYPYSFVIIGTLTEHPLDPSPHVN